MTPILYFCGGALAMLALLALVVGYSALVIGARSDRRDVSK